MVMSEVRCVCDLCAIGIQQDKMCYIGVQQCFKNGVYTIYEKRINCAKEKEIEFQWEMPDRECQNFMTDVYEENRFYRREVQQ